MKEGRNRIDSNAKVPNLDQRRSAGGSRVPMDYDYGVLLELLLSSDTLEHFLSNCVPRQRSSVLLCSFSTH